MSIQPEIQIDDSFFPQAFFQPHEEQAQRNQCRTIPQLAEKDTLSWSEAYAILSDRSWRLISEDVARPAVEALYEIWRGAQVKTKIDDLLDPQ